MVISFVLDVLLLVSDKLKIMEYTHLAYVEPVCALIPTRNTPLPLYPPLFVVEHGGTCHDWEILKHDDIKFQSNHNILTIHVQVLVLKSNFKPKTLLSNQW